MRAILGKLPYDILLSWTTEKEELERFGDVVAVAKWEGDKNSMRYEFMLLLSFDLWDLLRCVWLMLWYYSHLRIPLYSDIA